MYHNRFYEVSAKKCFPRYRIGGRYLASLIFDEFCHVVKEVSDQRWQAGSDDFVREFILITFSTCHDNKTTRKNNRIT
jgi:hypothetical protein